MNLLYRLPADLVVMFPRCGPLVGPPGRSFLAQPLADLAVGEDWDKVLRCGLRLAGRNLTPHTKHIHKLKLECNFERSASPTQTTLNNGYLGSRNDEERSEMRYLM